MAKIADVIKLKSGYANFVELKSAFEETQENAERLAMYRPTKAHRQAFERISRGVYQPTDKKFLSAEWLLRHREVAPVPHDRQLPQPVQRRSPNCRLL